MASNFKIVYLVYETEKKHLKKRLAHSRPKFTYFANHCGYSLWLLVVAIRYDG